MKFEKPYFGISFTSIPLLQATLDIIPSITVASEAENVTIMILFITLQKELSFRTQLTGNVID